MHFGLLQKCIRKCVNMNDSAIDCGEWRLLIVESQKHVGAREDDYFGALFATNRLVAGRIYRGNARRRSYDTETTSLTRNSRHSSHARLDDLSTWIPNADGEQVYRVYVDDVLSSGDLDKDPLVQPGDQIYVPERPL